mgnify:CR=1 FL=1
MTRGAGSPPAVQGQPATPVPGGGGCWRRAAPASAALAVVLVFWLVQFRGVLFQGYNLMGYPLLDPRITGAEPAAAKKKLNVELPGRDPSHLLTHFPYQSFLARHFRQGEFPLWNPEMGCGQPVASDPQYKPFNPFFWPYFASPTAWVFSLSLCLMALFGMLGAVLFFREAGLGWPAATVGGLLSSFNALTQQTVIVSDSWAVWTLFWGLYGVERFRKGQLGGLAAATAAAALMVYAGHPTAAFLCFTVLAAHAAFFAWGVPWRTRALALAVLIAGVFILAAAQLVPFLANFGQYTHDKTVWDGGPYHDWWLLANPKSLIYVPLPVWGLAAVGVGRGDLRLKVFFLALSVYGALTMFPWIGPGAARWFLSLGGTLLARYGQDAFYVGLSGLSALGVQGLADSRRKGRPWAAARYFLYGALWHYALAWLVMETQFSLFWPRIYLGLAVLEALACLPALVIPLLPGRREWGAAAAACFLFAACLPAFLPTALDRYFTRQDLSRDPPRVVRAIRAAEWEPGKDRLWGKRFSRDFYADLAPNQSLFWGLQDVRITSPVVLQTFADFAQHWNTAREYWTIYYFPRANAEVLRFLGVRWAVRDAARPDPGLPVLTQAGALVLHEVDGPRPWVRAVGEWETAANRTESLKKTFALLRSGEWRSLAVVEAAGVARPAAASWEPPVIRWDRAEAGRMRWTVTASKPSLLLVLQNAHPGWKASVGGRRVPIWRAYGTFMALPLEAGVHEVTLDFEDVWFTVGVWVAGAGWLSLLVFALVRVFRPRAPSGSAA